MGNKFSSKKTSSQNESGNDGGSVGRGRNKNNSNNNNNKSKTSRTNNRPSKREQQIAKKEKYLIGWQVAAITTIALPLLVFCFAKIIMGDVDDGQQQSWWKQLGWNFGGQGDEENQGKGAIFFVYVWGLIVFVILVWRGNQVIEKKKDMRALFAALVLFANLSFLCWILISSLGTHSNGGNMGAGRFLGRFTTAIIFTFFLWTLFGVVFGSILHSKIQKFKNRTTIGLGRKSSNDYVFFEDDRLLV